MKIPPRNIRRVAMLAFLAGILSASGRARAADNAAIEALFKTYTDAFNNKDRTAVGECWTADAVYMDLATGERIEGRNDIARDFEKLFKAEPTARVDIKVSRIRQADEKTAMVEGIATLTNDWKNPVSTAFTALAINRDGRWRLDAVHEADAPPQGSAQGLKELDWLVGRWKDDGGKGEVESEFRWAPSGAYLLRSYASSTGDAQFQGTQIIGWDPTDNTIRSWTFDADGSFGQEAWEKTADGWRIRVRRVLPGGESALAIQIINQLSPDTFTAQWISGEIEGRMVPSGPAVTVRRIADAGKEKK